MKFQRVVHLGAGKAILSVAPDIVWPRTVFVTVARTVQTVLTKLNVKYRVSFDERFMVVEDFMIINLGFFLNRYFWVLAN